MAEFALALAFLLPHEGGYNNSPLDKGGETYKGIARNYHANWAGWSIIDGVRGQTNFPARLETIQQLEGLVISFYHDQWWAQALFSSIASQTVANKVFDLTVNFGIDVHVRDRLGDEVSTAFKILQRACDDCGEMVVCDGDFGPVTLAAVNRVDEQLLLEAIRNQTKNVYVSIVAHHPEAAVWLKGWLNRAAA